MDAGSLRTLVAAVADEVPEALAYIERWLLQQGLRDADARPAQASRRLAEPRAYLDDRLNAERLAELEEAARDDRTAEGQEAGEELDDIGRDLRDLVEEVAGQALPDQDDDFVVAAIPSTRSESSPGTGGLLTVPQRGVLGIGGRWHGISDQTGDGHG